MHFWIIATLTTLFGIQKQQAPFLQEPVAQNTTDRPMIGLLTQPLTESQAKNPKFKGKTSYVMQNYA